jgi:two-component system cell cycle sensor histidine kinase/response regulator CckA
MTILAVDDEPLVRTLVATVLEENGFDVLTADCGARAIAAFHESASEIDLLISDIVMPGMDGPSLAAQLLAERPELKVILMSGYCAPEQLDHGYEFLPKPFSLPDMLARVRRMVGAQELRAEHPMQNGNPNQKSLTAVSTH